MNYEQYNKFKNYFWIILGPLSYLFACIVFFRRSILKKFLISYPHIKIICVGNIHSGGSGKTPVVLEIAKHFDPQKVIILSKGYRGTFKEDLEKIELQKTEGAAYYGDEPWMMAHKTEAPVYVTKDRKKALSFMNQNFMGAVVILDDGFQDIRIQKKASVVVMNGHKDPEDMFCLPYGELREPITALKDAMAIVLTNPTPAWKELLKKQTLFEANKKITPSHPTTKKESCVAFCGIGEPSNFYQDLENFYTICQFVVFDDHHPYSSEDVENLLKMKEKTRATCLVTTEKDYAKVNTFLSSKMQTLQTLKLEYVIEKGFFELLKKTLND